MRILLSTTFLNCLSGSELFIYDLARGLRGRGHDVTVWVKQLVPTAPLPRLLTFDDVRMTPELPEEGMVDAVIFQLKETWPEFERRYLDVPRFAVCHGPKLPAEIVPADFPHTTHLALTHEGYAYLKQNGYANAVFTGYGVDLDRFAPTGELPERPRRAVAHSKYVDPAIIQGACEELGIELITLGRGSWQPGFDVDHYADVVQVLDDGTVVDRRPEFAAFHVERLLADADIVFGLGRSAVEALAMGKACVVFGYGNVGDGLVTPDRLEPFSRVNFSGRHAERSFTVADMVEELRGYSPDQGRENRRFARERYGLAVFLDRVERLLVGPERRWRRMAARVLGPRMQAAAGRRR